MIDGEMMPITWEDATRVIVNRLKNDKLVIEAELKRTKRALWLARAERAKDICDMADVCVNALEANKVQKVWLKVERKCRAYADKFKEEK